MRWGIGFDLNDICQNGLTFGSGAALAVDVFFVLVPFATGGGTAVRAAALAENVVDPLVDSRIWHQYVELYDDEGIEYLLRNTGRLGDATQTALLLENATNAANRLVDIGLHSDESTQLVELMAYASAQNERLSGGFTILGSHPEYVINGTLDEMTYLNMPPEVWDTLKTVGDEYVWEVNKKFLDDSIDAGHSFVVILGEGKQQGKYLKREIEYLESPKIGYHWVDGILVPK
jgi:hypothetical protein